MFSLAYYVDAASEGASPKMEHTQAGSMQINWICSTDIYVCVMKEDNLNKWTFYDILIIQEGNGTNAAKGKRKSFYYFKIKRFMEIMEAWK